MWYVADGRWGSRSSPLSIGWQRADTGRHGERLSLPTYHIPSTTYREVSLPKTRMGFITANTGPGKGKVTAAPGTALRRAVREVKVLMVQFRRGSWQYGELSSSSH